MTETSPRTYPLMAPEQLFTQPKPPPLPAKTAPSPPQQSPAPMLPDRLEQGLPKNRSVAPPPVALIEDANQQVSPGVIYEVAGHTKDGAPIHVVTLDPTRVKIAPIFDAQSRAISPQRVTEDRKLLAAINASFFSSTTLIGDLKGEGGLFLDDNNKSLDQVTDQRYFFGLSPEGKIYTGKGGFKEAGGHARFQSFLGGMPALYTASQKSRLEEDIQSGAFAKRATYGGASPDSSISRSFLGVTADGKVLLVTTGQGAKRSQGASMAEAARILRNLGAQEAYILDGGGSTSLYVQGELNTRSDGRLVKSYLGAWAR